MTKTLKLLEQAAEKLGTASDYNLAQKLGLPRQQISDYRKEQKQADAYAATKIAIALGRDPLEVIAEIETEAAASQQARDFWSRFPSGLRRTALGVALSAIFATSAFGPRIGEAASPEATSHNGRLRQRPANDKSPRKGAFLCLALNSETLDLVHQIRTWCTRSSVLLRTVPERDRRRPGRPA